jgi:hypothetical protein
MRPFKKHHASDRTETVFAAALASAVFLSLRQASQSPSPAMQQLLVQLQALEVELHHAGPNFRKARVEELLHPQFHQAGRSGQHYDRQTVVRFLSSQKAPASVESSRFAVAVLAPQCALLTYESFQWSPDGREQNRALRSSIWVKSGEQWQLRYHQGTPAPP